MAEAEKQSPMSSVPKLEEFNPRLIPSQLEVMRLVRRDYDYSRGKLQILLSGSVGSAKSILLAHLAVTHALLYPGAGVLIGRRTLKDLKNTLWPMMLAHAPRIFTDCWNRSEMKIMLPNGSILYGVSWDNTDGKQFRSYPLSMAIIEELTENKEQVVHDEIGQRLERLPHIKENVFICATNPDSPSHWGYKYYIEGQSYDRRVFYSKTQDNPFLPPTYFDGLLRSMDAKTARRMLFGEWIEIGKEMIYYSFGDHNKVEQFKVNPAYPVGITWDFNIGDGKPMSAIAFQHIEGKFYFFDEYVVDGSRTMDVLEEMLGRGLFAHPVPLFKIYGDASGKHKDTRSRKSDYAIIEDFLSNLEPKISYEMQVPLSNPPIRTRHNAMNAALKNAKGDVTLFVDAKCKKAHEGLRLTAFKKGAELVEDDSKAYQHVTTAMGYAVVRVLKMLEQTGPRVRSY